MTISQKIRLGLAKIKKKTLTSLSIISLSKMIGVSPSSISRYVRKGGFSDYKSFRSYLVNPNPDLIQKHKRELEIFNKDNKVKELFSEIKLSRRILTMGCGSSSYAPRELAVGLCHLGFSGIYFIQFQDFLFVLPTCTKNDLIIIFSENAENKEIVFLLNQAQYLSARFWLIGSYRHFINVQNIVINSTLKSEIINTSYEESMIAQSLFVSSLLKYCMTKTNSQKNLLDSKLLLSEWNK